MGAQKGHQAAGQLLAVQNLVSHSACKGQMHASGLVLKFGPENAGGVQQVQALVDVHPLLATGDAGAVPRLGRFAAGHLVDEGGFAHVGHPHHHHPHGTAHLALGSPGLNLLPQGLLDHIGKLVDALAALGVGLQHRIALLTKPGHPLGGDLGVCLIGPVEDDHAGAVPHHGVNVRVAAGDGNAGIHHLRHHVHELHVLLHLAAGLGHMSGIPLDVHRAPLSLGAFLPVQIFYLLY